MIRNQINDLLKQIRQDISENSKQENSFWRLTKKEELNSKGKPLTKLEKKKREITLADLKEREGKERQKMKARARVEIDLISNAQRIFKFNLDGQGYDDIENQVQEFSQHKKDKYAGKIKTLSWEVSFLD